VAVGRVSADKIKPGLILITPEDGATITEVVKNGAPADCL